MDFEFVKESLYIINLGVEVIGASLLTILLTQIIKMILKKKKVINKEMQEVEKDELLTKVGRIVGLSIYLGVFILKNIILKEEFKVNEEMIFNFVQGLTMTLILAKGIYTMLHQYMNKKSVYEELRNTKKELSEVKTWTLQNKWGKENERSKKRRKY